MPAHFSILIINPNSSSSMTTSLRGPIESLSYPNTTYTYQTGPPSSPPSINDLATAGTSTSATLPTILPLIPHHDAFLIACYSPHPLVAALKQHTRKPVLGIFEASISTAVHLLDGSSGEKFGIVSTGEVWKEILGNAIRGSVLGEEKAREVFKGTETLGLSAGELHAEGGEGEVERRVKAATGRLIQSGAEGGGEVTVVVLGCAGMVGMEEWVREEVGREGKEVRVVDGVKAGVGILQGILRGEF